MMFPMYPVPMPMPASPNAAAPKPKPKPKPAPAPAPVVPVGPGVLRVPGASDIIRETTFMSVDTQNVKVAVIPNFVKKILSHAFRGWQNLKEVQFEPNSRVEEIDRAFEGAGLESFIAPDSLRVIGQCTFWKCKSLRYVKLNEGLTVVGRDELSKDGSRFYGAFAESALQSIDFPSTLLRIEAKAFQNCEKLGRIHLPKRLQVIAEHCFDGTAIRVALIPASVREIGNDAFRNCKNLAELNIEKGSSLQKIGIQAFFGTALTSVIVPRTTQLGWAAFDDNVKVTRK